MANSGAGALSPDDYTAIEFAVQETTRGRWFLAEFARRNRQADTLALVEAMARLEQCVRDTVPNAPDLDCPASGKTVCAPDLPDALPESYIAQMAGVLATARSRIEGTIAAEALSWAGSRDSFDWMQADLIRADGELQHTAEQMQDVAWQLRDGESPEVVADLISGHMAGLYAASNALGCAIERISVLSHALRSIENAALGRKSEEPFPVEDEVPVTQTIARRSRNAGLVLDDDIVVIEADGSTVMPDDRPVTPPASFAALDTLSEPEKLAVFV